MVDQCGALSNQPGLAFRVGIAHIYHGTPFSASPFVEFWEAAVLKHGIGIGGYWVPEFETRFQAIHNSGDNFNLCAYSI